MALIPGTRVGPYEVVSLLGRGGMGEVYRARDHRLQRDVALKVLPEAAAADPTRRERFTREALAVAALNHPHIVTIHAVEEAGSDVVLAMELVHGRSLAETLPSGGLPLGRVLTIAIAVAEAMTAAHQKGITHRDLKPGNIMLGEGEHAGRIKVLDFGLAKRAEPVIGALDGETLPTVGGPAAPITERGQILGTVAYMSPEQAEGKAIDARSDLFSLGVVLYEMATGQRPFTGDTSVSILAAIVKDTPKSVTEVNPALPPDLARIIRRALAKDPERRYQSAKDLRNDLEDLRASLPSESSQPGGSQPATPAPAPGSAPDVAVPLSDAQVAVALARKYTRLLLAGVAVLALVLVTAPSWLPRGSSQPAPAESAAPGPSFADVQITQLTTSGIADRPAISPDGRYVVYVQHDGSGDSLWLRQTASASNSQIVAAAPGVTLFGGTFTPDATSIDFVRQDNDGPWEIWRIPFLGGSARRLITNVASPISWSPDGQRLAFLRTQVAPELSSQLIVADAAGGNERTLTASVARMPWVSLMAPWRPSFPPAWSPDGRSIAVAAVDLGNASPGRVLIVDSQTGAHQELTSLSGTANGLGWLDDRALVINDLPQLGAMGQLFRLPYPNGPVVRLTNDPNEYVGISLSGNRRDLVTGRRDARMDVWVGDAGGTTGKVVVSRVPIGAIERIAWSGDRLLYGGFVDGKSWILSQGEGASTPDPILFDALTPDGTSDGSTIAFISSVTGRLDLWTADATGRRIAQIATGVTAGQVLVTPDDRSVLYTSLTGGTIGIWTVPLAGGVPTKLVDSAGAAAVSPDGKALAFVAYGRDRASLSVCVLPGCTSPRTIGGATFNAAIAWTPDGQGVALARDGNLWVQAPAGGAPRQLTRLTDTRPIGSFAWSRDGRRLAVSRSTVTNDIVLFKGLSTN